MIPKVSTEARARHLVGLVCSEPQGLVHDVKYGTPMLNSALPRRRLVFRCTRRILKSLYYHHF